MLLFVSYKMLAQVKSRRSQSQAVRAHGLINTLINKLPVELHIPGYNYCGPGTRLQKRLVRGDKGVNLLDEACKVHDIAYSRSKDLGHRHEADKKLAASALERFRSSDASAGEKLAALGVSGAMSAKVKMGAGFKRAKTKKTRVGGVLSFRDVMKRTRKAISTNKASDPIKIALRTVKRIKRKLGSPRVIPVPKTGGILPLIPIFAGLSALGALSGGAAGIAKAINDAKSAREQLKESERHNRSMEAIAMGKGLYLKPYKKGLGLYLKRDSKNFQ